MKSKILKKLRESDGYVSGQELCDTFGVSRTAVWKAVNRLKEEGYEIDSVPKKGYRIVSSPTRYSADEIKSRLVTEWAGQEIYFCQETGSTNTEINQLAEKGMPHGTLAVAECQTGGKGRRGRGWVSPSGVNIYMSILLRPDLAPDQASMLTLVMALAASKAIDECCEVKTQIKWPNDILLHRKKIVGILTEMTAEPDYINHVVIGIGINTNQEEMPEEIKKNATSIRIETGKVTDRTALLERVMYHFENEYDRFEKSRNMGALCADYNERLVNLNQVVRVLEPGNEYEGTAEGIDETGKLRVVREDGTKESVYAGEVSVRGIYGYV